MRIKYSRNKKKIVSSIVYKGLYSKTRKGLLKKIIQSEEETYPGRTLEGQDDVEIRRDLEFDIVKHDGYYTAVNYWGQYQLKPICKKAYNGSIEEY